MIRPANFGYNHETAVNNAFQQLSNEDCTNTKAVYEFDNYVKLLRQNGVNVHVLQDTPEPYTPDSIFPNNWFSTHQGGTLVLYPMFAGNRRLERKPEVIDYVRKEFDVKRVVDLTKWEAKSLFLEGTGSMVLDRDSNLVYACASPRTDESVLEEFCEEMDCDYFLFRASDENNQPIYHTNVMMCVGSKFVLACIDAIKDISERENFIGLVEEVDKELIEISLEQMGNFAGNMLEVKNDKGESLLIMSARARMALDDSQIERLESYCRILTPDVSTIEINGGGSVRCMIAEIFV
ncbi:MAG: arginine deiminase-related protein [Bacteroidales bacterium]|nr:arginine deiminase-related protein [Bacteroidales bacterium]